MPKNTDQMSYAEEKWISMVINLSLAAAHAKKKKVTVIGTFAFHIHTSMEKNDVMGVTY